MKIAFSIPGFDDNTIPLDPVAGMPSGGFNKVEAIIQWAVTFLLVGGVVLALFFIIWGGISWITS